MKWLKRQWCQAFHGDAPLLYVGQGCWSHDYSGKTNTFRARAGLYICPAEECSGQLFFDLRSSTLQVVQAVSFASSPDMVLGT